MVVLKKALEKHYGKATTAIFSFIQKRKKWAFIIAGFLLAAYFLGISAADLSKMLIIIILLVVASFSTFYKRYFRAPPVFELMTFSTVFVTALYGLPTGLIFGAISQMASEALSGAVDAQIIIFVPARSMLALTTYIAINFFNVTDFFVLGLLAILAYNLMVQPISWFMGDMQLRAKTIYYTIFYTVCNFFIFKILSGPVNYLLTVLR